MRLFHTPKAGYLATTDMAVNAKQANKEIIAFLWKLVYLLITIIAINGVLEISGYSDLRLFFQVGTGIIAGMALMSVFVSQKLKHMSRRDI